MRDLSCSIITERKRYMHTHIHYVHCLYMHGNTAWCLPLYLHVHGAYHYTYMYMFALHVCLVVKLTVKY